MASLGHFFQKYPLHKWEPLFFRHQVSKIRHKNIRWESWSIPSKKKIGSFLQISYLKNLISTYTKDFYWKKVKIWEKHFQVARFMSWTFHYIAHIIKGCFFFFFLYLIYSQILLNLLIGQSQLWLHHKNWNLKTPSIPDFKAKLKVCLGFQAYWWEISRELMA